MSYCKIHTYLYFEIFDYFWTTHQTSRQLGALSKREELLTHHYAQWRQLLQQGQSMDAQDFSRTEHSTYDRAWSFPWILLEGHTCVLNWHIVLSNPWFLSIEVSLGEHIRSVIINEAVRNLKPKMFVIGPRPSINDVTPI